MLKRRRIVCALLITFGMQSLAGAAHGPYRVHCAPGMPCVPERITYGYFPTSWRRWPTDTPSAPSAAKQPESLPTPAKAASPVPAKTVPSTPDLIEEETLMPTTPGGSAPPADAPPSPPFDETPAATPGADELMPSPTQPPAATAPADVNETPATAPSSAPGSNTKPPAGDEDPFKDDPDSMGLPSADSMPSAPAEVYYQPNDEPERPQTAKKWRTPESAPARRPAPRESNTPRAVGKNTKPAPRPSQPLAQTSEPAKRFPVTQVSAQAPRANSKPANMTRNKVAANDAGANSAAWRPNPLRRSE